MKRTQIDEYDAGGPVTSCSVSIGLSRNERSKRWTLYFSYTDPESPGAGQEIVGFENAKEAVSVLEEHGIPDPATVWVFYWGEAHVTVRTTYDSSLKLPN